MPRLLLWASLVLIKVMRLQQKRATALPFTKLPEATTTRPQIGLLKSAVWEECTGGDWASNSFLSEHIRALFLRQADRCHCCGTLWNVTTRGQEMKPIDSRALPAQSISQHPWQERASRTRHVLVFGSRPPYSAFTGVNNNKNRSLLCCMFPPYTNCNNTEIFM